MEIEEYQAIMRARAIRYAKDFDDVIYMIIADNKVCSLCSKVKLRCEEANIIRFDPDSMIALEDSRREHQCR